ncbi:MAG: rhodanese-like domain-containing protein, partial [Culicoidibacterales bacterium]
MEHISLSELKMLANPVIIDVREPHEYQTYAMETAINIPMGQILMKPQDYLTKEQQYFIVCQHAVRSQRVCLELENA